MKLKSFTMCKDGRAEKEVNEFMKDKDVLDITDRGNKPYEY